MRRVVVTGIGAHSALGSDWPSVEAALHARENAVEVMEDWKTCEGLNTCLGVPVEDFSIPDHWSRRQSRSMGRVAALAVSASELALEDAGLLGDPVLKSGSVGVSYGSSTGSPDAVMEFGRLLIHNRTEGLNATSYVRMMSHTAAVNIGVFFGLTGRVITTSSACTAGSQGIGYAFEAIRSGAQDLMLAGGAEELSITEAAVFDTLYATSTRNDEPKLAPSPFDVDRDGLVLGEGAGTFVLEEFEHAKARGAKMICELVGYATNSDGSHVTKPNQQTIGRCLELSLKNAGLASDAIGYVNAHGTATSSGDVAESQATNKILGSRMPISSLKSYIGHSMGACGALEAWMTVEMLNSDWYAPTLNLNNLDPDCGELDYITNEGRVLNNEYAMSNNFAFGGINTSLIFRRLN